MRPYFLLFVFILVGCTSGGTMTLSGRNSAQGGDKPVLDSCALAADPLVLMDGYCVEAYGSPVMKSACVLAGGTYAEDEPCARAQNLVGRCAVRLGNGGLLTVYFANTTKGPARCAEALGSFEGGSNF